MDTIQELLSHPKWSKRLPATADEIKAMEDRFGPLPADYKALLEQSNGGSIYGFSTSFIVWSTKEVIQHHKEGDYYEYIPASVIFGSDGGGTIYCFDLRPGKDQSVFFIRHEISSSEPDAYEHIEFEGTTFTDTVRRVLNNEKLN